MKEYALIKKVSHNSAVLAHHNILVNAVNLIAVILIHAKIMEPVSSPSLTTFQHQNVNAREIMEEQLVTLTCAQTLNVETELVLGEPVNVMKVTSMKEMFAWTFVTVSIVESAVTVRKEFVVVMKVMPTLEMFVKTCVMASAVAGVETASMGTVTVKLDISMLKTIVKKHVH